MTNALADAILLYGLAWRSCPGCAEGRVARALVFDDAFWFHVWCVALPFVVTAVIVQAILRRSDRGAEAPRTANRRSR